LFQFPLRTYSLNVSQMYVIKYCFVIRCAKVILKLLWNCLLAKLATEIFPIVDACIYTRVRVFVFSLDTMCARQEYTLLIVGGCERKRGRERKKRGRGRTWKRWEREERDDERQEIQGTRPSKEFFSFSYFSCREYDILW